MDGTGAVMKIMVGVLMDLDRSTQSKAKQPCMQINAFILWFEYFENKFCNAVGSE